MSMSRHLSSRSEDNLWEGQFSPSTLWIPEIKLTSSGWETALLPAHPLTPGHIIKRRALWGSDAVLGMVHS